MIQFRMPPRPQLHPCSRQAQLRCTFPVQQCPSLYANKYPDGHLDQMIIINFLLLFQIRGIGRRLLIVRKLALDILQRHRRLPHSSCNYYLCTFTQNHDLVYWNVHFFDRLLINSFALIYLYITISFGFFDFITSFEGLDYFSL